MCIAIKFFIANFFLIFSIKRFCIFVHYLLYLTLENFTIFHKISPLSHLTKSTLILLPSNSLDLFSERSFRFTTLVVALQNIPSILF